MGFASASAGATAGVVRSDNAAVVGVNTFNRRACCVVVGDDRFEFGPVFFVVVHVFLVGDRITQGSCTPCPAPSPASLDIGAYSVKRD